MDYKIELIELCVMKNGFNHRNITSVTTMFIALLLLVSFYGCRTSKSIVEKHKESFSKEELQLNKFDSVTKVFKTNKITNFDSIGWNNYFKQYDISYNGTTLEDFGKIEKTDKGWKFSGKLNVNLKEDSNSGDFATIKNQSENINENIDIKSDSKSQNKVDESKSKVDKHKENKSFGPSFNSTIIITIAVVVTLILLWKFGLPKFKKR
ncbi:hypothetical protein HX096_12005 [Empedobacter falsenii]|uniref:hypothetical protein n=1 Tax=Empedobacter falsenii TaxID=343874 RepID=UPI002578C7FE|nr:hypothetical protein [Empedobacter falsenii]MDM1548576.1 hypothetical protein [Empedobacter falsenii]